LGLSGVEIVHGDIRTLDFKDLARQQPDIGRLDAVVHTAIAVNAATIAENPIPTLDTAVDGTRRVLGVARDGRARRFLFLSSGAVYGRPAEGITQIAESYRGGPDSTDPMAVYAEGKRIGEMMCACTTRAHGLETVMARGFAFVGPHLPVDRHFAIGNFIRDALRGGPVVVSGDGTPIRSYQYAADMAIWLWALLVRGASGRAYNVGASREISVGDLARLVAAIADNGSAVDVQGTPMESAIPDRYVPDVRLATDTLGVEETVTLEEAIVRTIRWHRGIA
jgi:dTDP-glucose 4,6-dehydratase